jgi:hypothetical protein
VDFSKINRSHINTTNVSNGVSGNPPEFFGMALVAYIDLLGFSADIKLSWGVGDLSPLSRLMRIKEHANFIPAGKLVGYFPDNPRGTPRIHGARVHTISDSIAICSALPATGDLNDLMMAVITVLSGVQNAWNAAIREGYTIRGGVEMGEIFWSREETVGPALVRAYELESKIAKTSRVIFGPVFLENLIDRMNEDWSAWPYSEWMSVSHDRLIEFSPHELRSDVAVIGALDVLREKAGSRGDKYDHLLKVLRYGFDKATPTRIKAGMSILLARCRTEP